MERENMKNVNLKQNCEILFLIITLLVFAACSSGFSTKKSSKDSTDDPSLAENPVIDPPSTLLEATRIICFQLNEDRSKIIGYYGIDDNGEPCPKDVVILNGISSIGNSAFENKALTSVFCNYSPSPYLGLPFEARSLPAPWMRGNESYRQGGGRAVTIQLANTILGGVSLASSQSSETMI